MSLSRIYIDNIKLISTLIRFATDVVKQNIIGKKS